MNCKEAKAAIDTTLRRSPQSDTVKSHLSGCPDCHRYSNETNALLSLLNAQPRVQAPADFDFRLRARIARAQSGESHSPGFLGSLWAKTFSWGQATTAMAALALVAAFSTYFINHDSGHGSDASASVTESNDVAKTQTPSASAPTETIANPVQNVPIAGARALKPSAVKFTHSSKTSGAALESVARATRGAQVNLALNDDATRFYNAEKRQVVSTPNRNFMHGVEGAGLAQPAVVALTF